jgi:hypothetical protein
LKQKINPDTISGREFEQAFFGPHALFYGQPEYLPAQASIAEALACQARYFNWRPTNPSTELSRTLFLEVRKALEPRHRHFLRLYAAIGLALDYWHGADGFFELKGVTVHIDLTANRSKKSLKAHFFVRPTQFESREATEQLGRNIALKLEQFLEAKERREKARTLRLNRKKNQST